MKTMSAKEQLKHDVKSSIFIKATSNPSLSKSRKSRGNNMSSNQDLKRRITSISGVVKDSVARK